MLMGILEALDELAITSPAPRPLPHIPFELSLVLASHLDFRSALQLMLTSKSLYTAGEIKVYSELDVTGSWTDEPIPPTLTHTIYYQRSNIVDRKLKGLIHGLDAHPHRRAYIRKIRCEISDGGPSSNRAYSLVHLLDMASPHLHGMDLISLPCEGAERNVRKNRGCETFFLILRKAQISFSNLIHLRYSVPWYIDRLTDSWMQMPSLREIEIYSADSVYNPKILPTSRVGTAVILPNLRRITVDHIDDCNAPITVLTAILSSAPNVSFLRIRGDWQPGSKDAVLKALGERKHLKTFICQNHGFWEESGTGIWMNRFGQVECGARMEEAAGPWDNWHEWEELRLDRLKLPKAPYLKRLSIFTSIRPDPLDYAESPLGLSPISIYHIPRRFLHYLRRSPLLTSVLFLYHDNPFPSLSPLEFVEPIYFIPPGDWEKSGHRGFVIREYADHRKSVTGQSLWHIRSLSRCVPSTEGESHHIGLRRCWRDWASYKDRRVPRDVLEAVYRSSGGHLEFSEGGRDMRLGHEIASWEILDRWRSGAGDVSEEEDGFVIDGHEDDDLWNSDGE